MADNLLSEELLSSLYAAATHRESWPIFCEQLSQSLNASVLMFGHCSDSGESLGLIGGNIDPDYIHSYGDYYGAINPWMSMNLRIKPGFVGMSDRALPRDELVRTEFYNDWLRHQNDAIAGPAMICHRSTKKFVSIAASASADIVDTNLSSMMRMMRGLSSHILHCVDISSALGNAQGASVSHLDACRHAIVLVHRSGRTGFFNEAARQFTNKYGLLRILRNDRLGSKNSAAAHHLRRATGAISQLAIGVLPEPLTMFVPDIGHCTFHAHIFPPSSHQGFPENVWSDPVAGAIVVTGCGGLDGDISSERIARSFGATPAEARLAGALVGGSTLYEYADQSRLSRHTARNQMRALLAKTEARDQTDFVRKIHMCLSPFKTSNTDN